MRYGRILPAMLACGLLSAAALAGINDDCTDAIAISVSPGGSATVGGSTVGSTVDGAPFCGTSNTSPGVWYSVIGTGNTMTVTTCPAAGGAGNFDTKLTVYCGECDNFICVGGNDDSCATPGGGLLSTVTWCSEAGAEYLVLVHGFGSAVGDFTLAVNDSGSACTGAVSCTPPDPINNDDCEGAVVLSVSPGGSATVDGSTTGATFDAAPFCGTSNTSAGVWYSVIGTGNTMTATTCPAGGGAGNFDTKLTVYCGNCDGFICVGGNDDACATPGGGLLSTVTWCSEPGAEYLILVHGFSASVGDFTLAVNDSGSACTGAVSCVPPPPVTNDDCEGAIALDVSPGGSAAIDGTTVGATLDGMPFCGTSNTAPGVWYAVIGTGNTMTATTCPAGGGAGNFDTKLTVYCQNCDSPVCVGGNDDACATPGGGLLSTVTWCSQPGAEYLILVHGFSIATGNFTLAVSDNGSACSGAVECLPPVPTGACCDCDGPDAICGVLTEEDCVAAGGVYLGDGTSCVGDSALAFSSSPNLSLPDNSPAGVNDTITVPKSFTVAGVNVGLTITHTWVGDLCVTLTGPDGTMVNLIQRPGTNTPQGCHLGSPFGCSTDNYNGIVLDDDGTGGPINDQCMLNLTSPPNYVPEEMLSAFVGSDAKGNWVLNVSDNAGGDLGTLVSWSLQFFAEDDEGGPCDKVVKCDPVVGDEGCSLGFWKNHPELWSGHSPDDLFSSVFADAFPDLTLHEVLSQPSGPPAPGAPPQLRNLGKQAVAALLNSTSVAYGMTSAEVIAAFNAAYAAWLADGNKSHLTTQQGIFGALNSQGCPGSNPADLNHDLDVDVFDLLLLLTDWGQRKSTADINGDGIVNIADLLVMLSQWGPAPAEWTPHE